MENGSLLPAALRYMQELRDNEHNLNFPAIAAARSNLHMQTNSGDDDVIEDRNRLGIRGGNSLIISIYCIDSEEDVEIYPTCVDGDKTNSNSAWNNNRKRLLQKLASIHNLIHTKFIPTYNKRYKHLWFSGGEGLAFGLHCRNRSQTYSTEHAVNQGDLKSASDRYDEDSIPHLRSVVNYGPHPLDEYYAMALMKCISTDLLKYYGIRVAIECWDVDDGQILLIEGANDLPSWVDDEIGVEHCDKRVYFVEGNVCVLPPSIKSIAKGTHGKKQFEYSAGDYDRIMYGLSRKEALLALVMIMRKEKNENQPLDQDSGSLDNFNRTILKRLAPFIRVINQEIMDISTRRSILNEYLHTAAVVLPLHLAIMIRHRPDLTPVAIISFCRYANDKDKRQGTAGDTTGKCNPASGEGQGQQIIALPFENLVYTSITISKTLYAMLLTAAGQLPPPMKIPKHYKSMELNRIRRQCKNGGVAYAHFRHAVEAGMRLSLGFEWIVSSISSSGSSELVHQRREEEDTNCNNPTLISSTAEDRINEHMVRIDVEAGGDGEWMSNAWDEGPNATEDVNNLSALVKCPVWSPEISNGGICPISHAGKSLTKHINEASKYARKKELSSRDISQNFPVPRAHEVDSDEWIDMKSTDDLEHKMKEIVGNSLPSLSGNTNVTGSKEKDSDETKMAVMNEMMDGLQKFVAGSSDIRGVSSESKLDRAKQIGINNAEEGINSSEIFINERIYLQLLQRMLTTDAENLKFDDILGTGDEEEETRANIANDDSSDLMKYFSNEDLHFNDEDIEEIHSNTNGTADRSERIKSDEEVTMKEVMREMDEQLRNTSLDREFNIPESQDDGNDDNTGRPAKRGEAQLAFDDPTVIKANVLSNLLQSLDAEGGNTGPASILMTEMSSSRTSNHTS